MTVLDDDSDKEIITEEDLKKNTHFAIRFSKSTASQLLHLCDITGLNRTDVIRFLIEHGEDVLKGVSLSDGNVIYKKEIVKDYIVNINHSLALYYSECPKIYSLISRAFSNIQNSNVKSTVNKTFCSLSLTELNRNLKTTQILFHIDVSFDPINKSLYVYIIDKLEDPNERKRLIKTYPIADISLITHSKFINRIVRNLGGIVSD